MRLRCPRSRPLRLARLMDHALRIALPRKIPNVHTWATVVPEAGAQVPGILYLILERDIEALDSYEDYPEIYGREKVSVESDIGAEEALIYMMNGPIREARPSSEYATTLRRGYRENGLPMEVLETALGQER